MLANKKAGAMEGDTHEGRESPAREKDARKNQPNFRSEGKEKAEKGSTNRKRKKIPSFYKEGGIMHFCC